MRAHMESREEGVAVGAPEDTELTRSLWVPRRRVPVQVQMVDRIPAADSGKHRYVISRAKEATGND